MVTVVAANQQRKPVVAAADFRKLLRETRRIRMILTWLRNDRRMIAVRKCSGKTFVLRWVLGGTRLCGFGYAFPHWHDSLEASRLMTWREDDIDRGLNFDWRVIQHVRPEGPLPDGFQC